MELKHYISILWKWAWLLLLAPLLSGSLSLMVSQQMQPVYRATTTLLVSPAGSSSSLNYSSLQTTERLARTYAELLTKHPLLEEVIIDLQLNLTPNQLADEKITVNQPIDTQLIELHVTDSDPQVATIIANSVAYTFLEQHDRRRTDRAVYVEIVEPAEMPAYKLRPRVYFNTIVAAFAGLVLTTGLVFLLDHLDDTLRHPENIEQTLHLSALATIPSVRGRALSKALRKGVPITALQPMSPLSEAYRMLRTNVHVASVDNGVKSLLITSSIPKEGKTTILANLAVVMAQGGKKVLLVDSDLREPSLHRMFNLPNERGLTDLLLAEVVPDESWLLDTPVPNLRLLPSGPHLLIPADLFSSKRMEWLINYLSTRADILLFDSPPVLATTDAAVLMSHVDAVLLIVESGRTSIQEVRKALKSVKRARGTILGTVLTRSQDGIGHYYGHYRNGKARIGSAGNLSSIYVKEAKG